MLFWVIVWTVSFLLFILVPLVCVPENRIRLYLRVTLQKWNVEAEVAQAIAADAAAAALARGNNNNNNSMPAPAAADANGDSDRNFHYVLSRAQEDEIRESFLTEKLQKYTFTLTPTSIQRLRSDTMATANSSTSVDSGGADAADAPSSSPYGDENDDADLEAAAAASRFQPPPKDSSPRNESNKETTATEDCCSSDDGLSDDGLLLEMDEFFDDSSMIILPSFSSSGGSKKNATACSSKADLCRQVPNGCAICLTSMDANDRITFSSDPKCNHIFHEQCMMDWLVASGRKFLKRQRREERNASGAATTLYRYNCQNPIEKILSFPMLCPCCRQPFVRLVDEEDDSDSNDSLAKPPTIPASEHIDADQQVAPSNDPAAAESVAEGVESPPVQDTADDDDVRGSQRTSITNDETSPTTTIAVGSDEEYY